MNGLRRAVLATLPAALRPLPPLPPLPPLLPMLAMLAMLAMMRSGHARTVAGPTGSTSRVPVLVYHRLANAVLDGMTVRVERFESHLRLLERLECRVVPLADVVAWRLGRGTALPPRAVALCADDGHRSQFELMAPMLRRERLPMTLFVYPSAISNADYAMTWPQLQTLADDALFSVQSHTWWHPNLLRDRARMPPEEFRRTALAQLRNSRATLERRLARSVSLLAWPFGLEDESLRTMAAECGYDAAFSLGNRSVSPDDPIHALPRHLMVDRIDSSALEARLLAAFDAGPSR